MTAIRIHVVDSAWVRQMTSQRLPSAPGIEGIGTAADSLLTRDGANRDRANVVGIDCGSPR